MQLNQLVGAERLALVVPILFGAFVKATAIILIGATCALFARGASAATRHLIWTLTLGGAVIAPAVSLVGPRWTIPVASWAFSESRRAFEPVTVPMAVSGASSNAVLALAPRVASLDPVVVTPAMAPMGVRRLTATRVASSRSSASSTSSSAVTWSSRTVVSGSGSSMIESRSVTVTPDVAPAAVLAVSPARKFTPTLPSFRWSAIAPWIIAVWLIGLGVALIPTVTGMTRLALVARRARPLNGGRWALLIPSAMRELDVRRPVRFVELDGPVMPMTWGVFRPIVLLPADDFNSTIEQRLDVLRHELAHVRRQDCLTQLVGQIACAVHWFNPLAWLAARELKVERERACDDEVLRAGAKASDYADYLLRVARSTRLIGAAALGGLAMARPSQMAGRLLAVLDDRRRRGRVSALEAAHAMAVAALVVAAIGSVSPVSAQRSGDVLVAPKARGSRTTMLDVRPVSLNDVDRPAEPAMPPEPPEPAVAGEPASAAELADAPQLALPANPTLLWSGAAAPTPIAALRGYVAASAAPCDRTTRRESGSHTSSTMSDNGSGNRWRVMWSEGDCSYEIDARGEVKYNRDVTDIESISRGGMFSIEQHIGDDTKRLVIRPRDDGTLERTYSVNGAHQEYDAAAKAWFAEALVALDRQTAFAADQRVPAILERGGVDAVLQEIDLVATDYARRRYYTKLLSMRQLDRSQVKRVVDQAGASMSSDYELAELLVAVSKLDAFGDDSHTSFVTAAKKINSDYERRRALNALLQKDRLAPATVAALLDAASTIGSDYELAELLIDVSKRYAINDQTRPTYIKALGSIQSDYEHRRVLAAIVAGGGLSPAVNRTLLEDARRIGSDYELAEFLIQTAKAGGLDASTSDAYFAAADKIKSDYEHHRALTPLLSRDILKSSDLAKAVLASAARIDSDYECASLLVEFANAITIDDNLRPAFEKAADTIQGEYEYGRAMAAVRRRVTR